MVSQHGMVMCVRVVDQLCVGGSGVRVDPVGAVVPDAAVLILDGYSECCVRRRIREIVSEERIRLVFGLADYGPIYLEVSHFVSA